MVPQLGRPVVEALREQAALVDHGVAGVAPPAVYPEIGHGEIEVCGSGARRGSTHTNAREDVSEVQQYDPRGVDGRAWFLRGGPPAKAYFLPEAGIKYSLMGWEGAILEGQRDVAPRLSCVCLCVLRVFVVSGRARSRGRGLDRADTDVEEGWTDRDDIDKRGHRREFLRIRSCDTSSNTKFP